MRLTDKLFLSLFLTTLSAFHLCYGQHGGDKDDDRVFWSAERRLTFNDFQGHPDKKDTTLHSTSPAFQSRNLGSIVTSIVVYPSKGEKKTTFAIYAVISKSRSWILGKNDKELLHEQGAFDLCEIYARMLRREIKKTKSVAEAHNLYDKITAEEADEQIRYDKENTYENGGITAPWKEKIATRLKELEIFSRPIVILQYN